MSYTASAGASMTVHAFTANLDAFAKKLNLAPKIVTQRIVTDLHGRVSNRTPVDTGRARASWDVKQGEPSEFVPPETKGSAVTEGLTNLGTGQTGAALGSGAKAGGAAKDVSEAVAAITGTAPVFITTALDYVKYLEDGSSSQAPSGMVRISLAELEIEVEDIIGQLP